MGQSARYQFTTADRGGNNHRLFIRWAFCQSRGGSCPKHHIRRNVCFLRWPRKGRSREAAETKREGSHGRNHRLAFFSFKHPLHQPPPDLSFTPCRLSSRPMERSCTRSFPPFHVGSERMRFYLRFSLFKVSAPFPVLLVDTVFYSVGCTIGSLINISIQYNKIIKYYIKLIKIYIDIYHFNLYGQEILKFNSFLHDMRRKDFLDQLQQRVSEERAREIHLDQDDRTRRPSPRREKGDDRWTLRHALYTGPTCTRKASNSSSNHQLPIRRLDSWKHGSQSKISGSDMAPPPSPYMATSRAYTRLLRKRER